MSSKLHTDIVNIAGGSIAFSIADEILDRLVLNSVRTAAQAAGMSVPSGLAGVDCRYTTASVDPKKLHCALRAAGSDVFVDIRPDIDFTLALHVSGDPKLEFSEITYRVTDLNLRVSGEAGALALEAPTFSVVGAVTSAATRAAALLKFAGTELDIQRLEGGMAFLFAQRVVGSILGTGIGIPLTACFPSITMTGHPALHVLSYGNKTYLLVIPDQATIAQNKECPEKTAVPPELTPSAPTKTGADQATWDISVGAISPPPPSPVLPDDPDIGVYLPEAVLDARFATIFPAIAMHYQDPGFVGWELDAAARVEDFVLALDPARSGIDISLATPVNGHVNVNVDVPCIGRVPIAYTIVCKIDSCDIGLLLRPGLADGKLSLRSSVDSVAIGKCTVIVAAFSIYLSYAGGYAAVVGLVLDGIVDAVLMHNLPIQLRHGISKALDNATVPLIDVGTIIPSATPYAFSTFDAAGASVLLGVAFNKG